MQAIINGEMYEVEPAVKVILDRLMTENAELKCENKRLLDKIQSFYKNEKLDLIDRERFLRELNDEIDEYAECRMAVTADELLEFIEEFEPVLEGELVARLSELEEENARLEEAFQKSIGVIAATDCVECKNEVDELLCDYGIKDISTLKYILDQYQKVIVNITNNRMSYLTYPAETILSVVSDIYNEDLEKAIDELNTELSGLRQNAIVFKPELMYTLKECEPKMEEWHNENPTCQNLQEIRYRAAKAEYDKLMKVFNGWEIKTM